MKRLRMPGAVGVALLVLAASAGIGSAHFIGNRWPYNNDVDVYLTYRNDAGAYPEYAAAVRDAAAAWWNSFQPVAPVNTTGAAKILANTVNATTSTYWGIATVYASWTNCTSEGCEPTASLPFSFKSCTSPCSLGRGWGDYTYARFSLNRATLADEDALLRQKVAGHEFGHTFGLAHSTCTAIMKQGRTTWNTPQQHDRYDLSRLYPSPAYPNSYAC
jgi:predicted Zn-dependent protease